MRVLYYMPMRIANDPALQATIDSDTNLFICNDDDETDLKRQPTYEPQSPLTNTGMATALDMLRV